MNQEEFVTQIAQFLEAAGILFMVAGSHSRVKKLPGADSP
jgi:hypothetical protein